MQTINNSLLRCMSHEKETVRDIYSVQFIIIRLDIQKAKKSLQFHLNLQLCSYVNRLEFLSFTLSSPLTESHGGQNKLRHTCMYSTVK